MVQSNQDWIATKEIAEFLNITTAAVSQKISKGELRKAKRGWVYKSSWLDYLQRHDLLGQAANQAPEPKQEPQTTADNSLDWKDAARRLDFLEKAKVLGAVVEFQHYAADKLTALKQELMAQGAREAEAIAALGGDKAAIARHITERNSDLLTKYVDSFDFGDRTGNEPLEPREIDRILSSNA